MSTCLNTESIDYSTTSDCAIWVQYSSVTFELTNCSTQVLKIELVSWWPKGKYIIFKK